MRRAPPVIVVVGVVCGKYSEALARGACVARHNGSTLFAGSHRAARRAYLVRAARSVAPYSNVPPGRYPPASARVRALTGAVLWAVLR